LLQVLATSRMQIEEKANDKQAWIANSEAILNLELF
jgi:hypothetical protein